MGQHEGAKFSRQQLGSFLAGVFAVTLVYHLKKVATFAADVLHCGRGSGALLDHVQRGAVRVLPRQLKVWEHQTLFGFYELRSHFYCFAGYGCQAMI